MFHGLLGKGFQAGAWLEWVVIVYGVAPRLNFVLAVPVADDLRTRAVFQVEADFVITRVGLVHAAVVDQRHGVFAVVVLHKVIDSFLLHQATDKVEVSLAVLAAVVPFGKCARGLVLEAGQATNAFEDVFDDLRHGLVLEDAAVRLPGQKPQPGVDRSLVDVGLGFHGPIYCVANFGHAGPARNVAIEVARLAAGHLHPHRHVLAKHFVGRNVGALALEPERELAQPGQVFVAREFDEHEDTNPERGGDIKRTCHG